MENTKQATMYLIAIVVLAVSLGFVLGSPILQAVTVPFDPETKITCVDFNRAVGTYPGQELFDDQEYTYAWERTGQSEKIALGARHTYCNNPTFRSPPRDVRWYFYIDNGAGTEVRPTRETSTMDRLRTDALPDGVYASSTVVAEGVLPAPPAFRIDGYAYKGPDGELRGIHDGSVLHVHLWIRVLGAGGETIVEGTKLVGFWAFVAEDEARLRSGIPDLEWGAGAYKVGQTAVACWEIPRVSIENATAYYATVLELNGHTAVKDAAGKTLERVPVTSLTGCFRVPVVDAYFADQEPCTNALRAIMYSPLLRVDDDETSVQPAVTLTGGEPPAVTDVRFDRKEYREGETIHVILTGSGRITKWYVRATIEGLEALPGTFLAGGSTANVTFVATQTGTLELETRPYNGCVPGETKEFRVVIEPEIPSLCELFPDVAECTDGLDGLPWFALAVGVVLALTGVGILVGSKGNVVRVLVGVGLLVLGVVLFGGALIAIVGAVL